MPIPGTVLFPWNCTTEIIQNSRACARLPLTAGRDSDAFSSVDTTIRSTVSGTGALQLRSATGETRITALDGMRGMVVLLVMYFHLLPDAVWPAQMWLRKAIQTGLGGGVDLFFVLSGFLITGILLDTRGQPRFYRNFYARRVLRIFPLYYGALAVVFGLLPALGVLGGASFEPIRSLSTWHWAYLSNVAWFLHPAGLDSTQVDLRHLWSLAIEEHFYLVWPLVVGLAATPRRVLMVCVPVFLASLALRTAWALNTRDFSLFVFLTPCRLDAIAAGSFIAAVTRLGGDWRKFLPLAKACLCGSVTLLAGLLVLAHANGTVRSLGIALASIFLASALFIALNLPAGSLTLRVLTSRFLCFFGRYSYGLYVIHGLLMPFLARKLPAEPWVAALGSNFLGCVAVATFKIALVIPLALLSWHAFEKQFLKLKRRFA